MILEGLIGFFPFIFGVAFFLSTYLYDNPHYDSLSHASFTMFYVSFGDYQFDAIYSMQQQDNFITIAAVAGWIWISGNVILRLTLAMTEEGFTQVFEEQPIQSLADRSLDPAFDPPFEEEPVPSKLETPRPFSNLMRVSTAQRLLPLQGERKRQIDELYNKYLMGVDNRIRVSEYLELLKDINSKKQMMRILSYEELNIAEKTNMFLIEHRSLSSNLSTLM
jgi:hypothetical protein